VAGARGLARPDERTRGHVHFWRGPPECMREQREPASASLNRARISPGTRYVRETPKDCEEARCQNAKPCSARGSGKDRRARSIMRGADYAREPRETRRAGAILRGNRARAREDVAMAAGPEIPRQQGARERARTLQTCARALRGRDDRARPKLSMPKIRQGAFAGPATGPRSSVRLETHGPSANSLPSVCPFP
jgi:hypothetical protein